MSSEELFRPLRVAVGEWRKSSYSSFNGNCVEIAAASRGSQVGVRDSKAGRKGPILWFSVSEWVQFLGLLKNGDLAFC